MTWADAVAECEARDQSLLTIDSAAKMDLVVEYLMNAGNISTFSSDCCLVMFE